MATADEGTTHPVADKSEVVKLTGEEIHDRLEKECGIQCLNIELMQVCVKIVKKVLLIVRSLGVIRIAFHFEIL